MFELKTTQHSRWKELLTRLALDEYEFEISASPKTTGAPVVICPDRFFSTWTNSPTRLSDYQPNGEVEFSMPDLRLYDHLVQKNILSEDDAVALYEGTLDRSIPALDRLNIQETLYSTDNNPVDFSTMTLEGALDRILQGELYVDGTDYFYDWGLSSDEGWETLYDLQDELQQVLNNYRIHRIDAMPDWESHAHIWTEWHCSDNLVDLAENFMYSKESAYRSYHPHSSDIEPPITFHRHEAYKGGGFSCIS